MRRRSTRTCTSGGDALPTESREAAKNTQCAASVPRGQSAPSDYPPLRVFPPPRVVLIGGIWRPLLVLRHVGNDTRERRRATMSAPHLLYRLRSRFASSARINTGGCGSMRGPHSAGTDAASTRNALVPARLGPVFGRRSRRCSSISGSLDTTQIAPAHDLIAMCSRDAETGKEVCKALIGGDDPDCFRVCLDAYAEAHPAVHQPGVRAEVARPPSTPYPDPYRFALLDCVSRARDSGGSEPPVCRFNRPLDEWISASATATQSARR